MTDAYAPQGMERGQQPPPPSMQNQRPREPIRWQQPPMEAEHGPMHPHMERPHQRQLDMHMGPPRQPHMERQHPHEHAARMLPTSAPALPFPPGMGDLLKQRLDMTNAGMSCFHQQHGTLLLFKLRHTALGHFCDILCGETFLEMRLEHFIKLRARFTRRWSAAYAAASANEWQAAIQGGATDGAWDGS